MIESLHMYSQHTLFGIAVEGIPALIKNIASLVNQISMRILIEVAISGTLFYLHHNLFALGFVIGFVFDKQIREVVEKVDIVYHAQRSLLENLAFFVGGGFLALLTMQTSMPIATFYYSAKWGALLYKHSLARQPDAPEDVAADDIV